MRISMVTGDDLTAFRGGTIHLMEQAENLAALGHDVRIFAQDRGPLPRPTPVPIRYLPAPGSGLRRLLTYNRHLRRALFAETQAERPDVIHTRQMGYSDVPLRVARRLGLPHVLEVNGVLRDELTGSGSPSRLRLALIDRAARRNLHGSDAFTTTTTEYRDRLDEVYGIDRARWAPMPCGVNEERFRPGDRRLARQRLQLPEESFALLHVGSLYDWRGLDLLLEGLAGVDATLPWELWLVGDGVERPRLERQAVDLGLGERVRFVGQVAYDEVPEWLVAADVGVVLYKPTRPVPGDPMKIYEYMACGLPILAGDHPHYGGLVRPAEAGVVVDDTDPAALARAVADLHADPERRQVLARNAVAASGQFTWRRRAEDLAALFERVVAQHRS
jgi:glycosyltransferase involved in cell wall biosynthesis